VVLASLNFTHPRGTMSQLQTLSTVSQFKGFLDKLKPQLALALPKHLTADRMTRLAMSVFSSNPALAECRPHTIAASIMTAAQLGLEPNVNGQGYLIPYKGTCTFVPGWKGLVDLANRSGRCTVWTGAVFAGDDFDYGLGDNPFIRHKPGDEDDPDKLMFVYAVGRIRGQDIPVIEVWSMRKVWKHRDRYNKVGAKHYSNQQPEMYARKVPLLQVLKYMPQSIELTAALAAANAAEEGRTVTIDAETWVPVTDPSDNDDTDADRMHDEKPGLSPEEFAKKSEGWKKAMAGGKTVNDMVATAETKNTLTLDQKAEIASWAQKPATEGAEA
jgi:recombination protein RecT